MEAGLVLNLVALWLIHALAALRACLPRCRDLGLAALLSGVMWLHRALPRPACGQRVAVRGVRMRANPTLAPTLSRPAGEGASCSLE